MRETTFDGSFRGHVAHQGKHAVLTDTGCLLVATDAESQFLLDLLEVGDEVRGFAKETSRDRDRVEVRLLSFVAEGAVVERRYGKRAVEAGAQ
jgi:hypothetical protein